MLAKPIQWTSLRWEELEEHTLINCPLQHGCLNLAAKLAWRGYSCQACQIFELGKEAEEEGMFNEFFRIFAKFGTGEKW